MKTFLLAILCLVCCKVSAQQWYLEKADATKLPISSASVDRVSNKVRFRILGANKDSKARFDDISSIYYNGRTFKVFKTDRKPVGFYVLTQSADKLLGFFNYARIVNKGGGFERIIRHVDMAIFDAAGKLLERYDLSQANSSENIDIRASASAAIRKHFVACPELLHALEAYENPEKADPEALLHFFEQAKGEISCK